jgi:hypothetical protein
MAAALFRSDDRRQWRQTMRLAQIIIFLVGVLAAVGLLIMEGMAS